MARSILSLFSRSPWGPIQEHMRAVTRCTLLLEPLMDAVMAGDHETTARLAEEISILEHQADKVKNELRDHLPRSIFLPVAREDLLDILHVQDGIADAAEDVSVIVTLRRMEPEAELAEPMRNLVRKALEAVSVYDQVIAQLPTLVEVSFAGPEAERVMRMVGQVSVLEHEADVAQSMLSRKLFDIEDSLKAAALYMWIEIIRRLATVADKAERAANRLRMFIAT